MRCTSTVTFDNGFGGTMMLECHQRTPHPEFNHYDAVVGIYWAYTGVPPPLVEHVSHTLQSEPMYQEGRKDG